LYRNNGKGKYPLIGDFKDGIIHMKTKKVINDFLMVDSTVFKNTKMCAFIMSKVVDKNGETRAETVLQFMQKMRDDVTDQRAILMRDISEYCTGKCAFSGNQLFIASVNTNITCVVLYKVT
jgi:hypothetical protein